MSFSTWASPSRRSTKSAHACGAYAQHRAICPQKRHDPKDAARALGVTQPRLNLLLKHRIELFSLDALVNMATRAGMKVKLTVKKAA